LASIAVGSDTSENFLSGLACSMKAAEPVPAVAANESAPVPFGMLARKNSWHSLAGPQDLVRSNFF